MYYSIVIAICNVLCILYHIIMNSSTEDKCKCILIKKRGKFIK